MKKRSIWSYTGLPLGFGATLLTLCLILLLYPYIQGISFGIINIPEDFIDPSYYPILKILGPFLFVALGSLFIRFIKQDKNIETNESKPSKVLLKFNEIKFESIDKLDPISLIYFIRYLDKGDRQIRITWHKSTLNTKNKLEKLIGKLKKHSNVTSEFRHLDPEKVAQHIDNLESQLTKVNRRIRNVERRIPIMWKSIRGCHYRKTAIVNLLKIVSVEISIMLGGQILKEFPGKNKTIDNQIINWVDLVEAYDFEILQRKQFSEIFKIREPIYSAEIIGISNIQLNFYAYGGKSNIIEALKDSRESRAVINGWFGNILVPQVEYYFILNDDFETVITYREYVDLGRIRDENNKKVTIFPYLY